MDISNIHLQIEKENFFETYEKFVWDNRPTWDDRHASFSMLALIFYFNLVLGLFALPVIFNGHDYTNNVFNVLFPLLQIVFIVLLPRHIKLNSRLRNFETESFKSTQIERLKKDLTDTQLKTETEKAYSTLLMILLRDITINNKSSHKMILNMIMESLEKKLLLSQSIEEVAKELASQIGHIEDGKKNKIGILRYRNIQEAYYYLTENLDAIKHELGLDTKIDTSRLEDYSEDVEDRFETQENLNYSTGLK